MVFLSFFFFSPYRAVTSSTRRRRGHAAPAGGRLLLEKRAQIPAGNAELLHIFHKSSRRPAVCVTSKQIFLGVLRGSRGVFLFFFFFRTSRGTAFWSLQSASDAKATRGAREGSCMRGAGRGAFWALPGQHSYCSLFSTTKTVGRRSPDTDGTPGRVCASRNV